MCKLCKTRHGFGEPHDVGDSSLVAPPKETIGSLATISEAIRMLAGMESLEDIRHIRDIADTARAYARAKRLGMGAQNHAGKIAVEAWIRQGEVLEEMDRKHLRAKPGDAGGKPPIDGSKREPSMPTLVDLDTTKAEAAKAQALAAQAPAVRAWYAEAPLVTPAYAARVALKARYRAEAATAPPLPAGTFDVIMADPPWEYANSGGLPGQAANHYSTMTNEEIAALALPTAENAVLFLWVTNPLLAEGLELARRWGFEYKTNIVWIKRNLQRPGVGFYVRGRHELLFICTKGSMVPDQEGRSPIGSVVEADIRKHSEKPDEVYVLIEALYPGGRYLELFARRNRPGWTTWGANSAPVLAETAAVDASGE